MAMRVSNSPSTPWILANAAGFVMGGAIAAVVVLAGEEPLVGTVRSQAGAAAALAPVTAVSLGLFGLLVGLAQWLALQRWWSISGWWIAATAGGWAAAGAIAGTLSGFLSGTVTGVGPGIGVGGYVLGTLGAMVAIAVVPGVLQSLVIRHRVGGLGWPAAHLAGQGAGFIVAFPVMLLVASRLRLNLPSAEAWVVAGLIWGTVFGIVTSRALDRAMATALTPEQASTRPGWRDRLSRGPIGRRRPVKIARIAVLAGVLSAASLGFMPGDAAAYGQADGPIAQIEFSGNCNNPGFVLCYPPDQGGFGLGGIWLWIEIDGGAGATGGDADIAGSGCGHIRGVGGGAFSIRGEFDWWWSAAPEGADVTFGTYAGADGYYNVELGPNDVFSFPVTVGHYPFHPAPAVAMELQVAPSGPAG